MSNILNRLKHVQQSLSQEKIGQVAYETFKKVTPIRSGYAKRHTRKVGKSIVADYGYATQLEHGKSKQAPDGMTEPTIKAVREYIKNATGVDVKVSGKK